MVTTIERGVIRPYKLYKKSTAVGKHILPLLPNRARPKKVESTSRQNIEG